MEKRKIDAIISDMDGTLVSYPNGPFYSSWDALVDCLPEDKKIEWFRNRDFYYPQKDLHHEWFKSQVNFLKGFYLEEINKVLLPIPYNKGVKEFFGQKNGLVTGILSAGINLVADRIAEELKFDYVVSNYLEVYDGVLTGEGKQVSIWNKHLDLIEMVDKIGLDLQRVVYIGDNENDIGCFELVGIPVGFNPKTKKTKDAVEYIIDDFRELNYILN